MNNIIIPNNIFVHYKVTSVEELMVVGDYNDV